MAEDHVVHDTVHDTVIEHNSGREPNWMVRIGLAVGGLLLLAGALAAWQMQDKFGGTLATALPWLVAGAILLGAAAILESITTEIWVTLLAGVFLLGTAFIVTGRVTVQLDQPAHSVFVIDRFTGEVRVCGMTGCRDLPGFGAPVTLPTAQEVRQDLGPQPKK
ncbi:MAG TPA: hypothetical protein VGG48_06050 [Rhizomicrobium sp.]|jgi:hypothetical protein